MTGAEILLKTLTELKVDTIFGYPGSSILPVYDALPKFPIRHVLTSHETGAGFAASGMARATGKPGVVLATSGPGATNLVTTIADAFMDSVPLIAITGNVELKNLGHDCFQEVDVFGMTMPIVKYSYIVKSVDDIESTVYEAFEIATSGRKGPVLIDIPFDVLTSEGDFTGDRKNGAPTVSYDFKDVNKIADVINKSEKPFLYLGGGAIDYSDKIIKLAKLIKAQIGVSFMALGCVPSDFNGYAGIVCDDNKPMIKEVLSDSDLIITLGARFNNRISAFEKIKNKPIIQIDIDGAEIDKNVLCNNYLIADIGAALEKLMPLLKEKDDRELKTLSPVVKGRGKEIIFKLSEFLPDDAIIVTDVGLHQIWTASTYPFKKPRTFITSGGLGVMGFGMGAAIGISLATDKKVVLITGDGSLRMNIAEFETAVKLKTNLTVVCMNNSSLGLIKKIQAKSYGKHFVECAEPKLNFANLAKAYCGDGIVLSKKDDVEKTLEQALKIHTPCIVDCEISDNEF
ncbi:MAG: thiamine pyrophosphate-binding protein [Christensenellales bacterium]